MIQRWLLTATVIACAATAMTAPIPEAGQGSPFLTARLQPVDKLLEDAKFLAGKFGSPEAAAEFQSKILHQIGADSIADMGIDPKKPSGLYVFSQGDVTEPACVVMLPVANEKSILDFVGKFEVKAEKLEDNFYSLAIPENPLPVFVRFANDYAYVTFSNKTALVPAALMTPARMFAAEESAVFAVTVRPEQVPEGLRKIILAQMTDYVKEVLSEIDAEDDYPDLTEAQTKSTIHWLGMVGEGGKEITFRTTFDRPSGELVFDTSIQPKTGSKLAEAIATIKAGSSLFTKMMGDRGAVNYFGNWLMDTDEAKELATYVQDSGAELMVEWLGIDDADEKSKEEVVTFCKELVPTAETGEIDVALSLRAVGDHYVLLGGTRLKDGQKIEEALRKLIAAIPEDKRSKVTLDAKTIGDVKLHEVEYTEQDAESEKIFGKEAKLYVAMKDNALVFGFGLEADKAVAESIAEAKVAPAPNFQVDVSVKKLKNVLDATWGEEIFPHLEGFFGKDADRVRIISGSLEGGQKLKARVSINLQMIVGTALSADDMLEGIPVPAIPVVPPAAPPPPQQPPA